MSTSSNGSSINTYGRIMASDLNDIANHYRQWFSVSYSAPSVGSRITADNWNQLRQAILNGAGSAYSLNNFPDWVSSGNRITSMTWGNATANFSTTTITYTTSGSYTIPVGCNSMTVNQIVGGGGGSGGASVKASLSDLQASSAGAGSGGFMQNISSSVSPGQTINIIIGMGGSGNPGDGSNGNSSYVQINGNTLCSVSGGYASTHGSDTIISTAGAGGSPNGNSGSKSSSGGPGGSSPYGGYGAGGNGVFVESPDGINSSKSERGISGGNGYASITFNP